MKKRNEIKKEDTWDLSSLYPSFTEWEKEFKDIYKTGQKLKFPQINTFKNTLAKGPEQLKNALETLLNIERKLEKLYTYAHLRHDEDLTEETAKKAYEKALSLYNHFSQESAWFQPELFSLPENKLQQYLNSPTLSKYRFYLEKMLRMRKHTLNKEIEEVIALAKKPLATASKTFSAIHNADFRFGTILNKDQEEKELTHASYSLFLRDTDRTLRKNAFKAYHNKYLSYQNTLTETLSGQVSTHIFEMRARKFSSCLEAALYPKNIPISVYKNLIKTVNNHLEPLHRYYRLRKKLLGYQELHLYDIYVPLISANHYQWSYQEAENLVIESVKPLGEKYQSLLETGLKKNRWVDRFENKGKRSGAYSSGCYDSNPYILMNYTGDLRNVFTLAHEAGHSMHSLLSRKHQPYHYSDYPIFLAEVASTFNEELLIDYILHNETDSNKKIYFINQKIEDLRATLFRQVMFAEFELFIHEQQEKDIPLTPSLLKESFYNLNKKYFGNSVIIDSEIAIEWARIPHFYYNFYVFQYATGISAAMALSEKVLKEGAQAQKNYLNFLSSGSSKYPIETLLDAGVDMSSSKPIEIAISKFDKLVETLEQLTQEKASIAT